MEEDLQGSQSPPVAVMEEDLQDSQPEDTLHPMHQEILRNFLNNNLNWVTSEGNGPVWERYFSLRRSLEKLAAEFKEEEADCNGTGAQPESNNDSAASTQESQWIVTDGCSNTNQFPLANQMICVGHQIPIAF